MFQSDDARVADTDTMTASIVSPTIPIGRVCLKFWYLMPNQNSKLGVYTTRLSDNTSSLIYQFEYESTSRWKQVVIPVDEKGPFTVIKMVDTC